MLGLCPGRELNALQAFTSSSPKHMRGRLHETVAHVFVNRKAWIA